jgi:hypothetical protein
VDENEEPPSRYAFSWVEGLLLYGTPDDDVNIAWDTWILTHPDLRLKAAQEIIGLSAGIDLADELAADDAAGEHELWDPFAPRMMEFLQALLPDGLKGESALTALDKTIPEGLDRQTVVFVPGRKAPVPIWLRVGESHGFGITVVRHPHGWRVVSVQREWTYPQWMADIGRPDIDLPQQDSGDGE